MGLQRLLVALLLLALGLGTACAPGRRDASVERTPTVAERPEAPETALEGRIPLDPAYRTGRLDNGVNYYVRQNPKPEQRAEIWLAVDAGSMQEDDDQRGLAHFVEHMAFNGTQHFAKQQLVDYLESVGMRFGPDLNAYTNFDQTVYMLQVPTDDTKLVERAFLILEDWAHGIAFEGQEIELERGVVLEERRSGRGAGARIRDRQFPVLFRDSRYAERLPIGDESILENAPHDALRRFYDDWYRPDLMAVIVVGDLDPETAENLIRDHFSDIEAPAAPRPREAYPVPDHEETLVSIVTDPEATSTSVAVYYKLDRRPQGNVTDYRRSLVEGLYHAMINARLNELRQKPDPPFLGAYSSSGRFVRSRDVYFQAARVEDDGLARGLDALLVEIERVDRHGFTQSELERTKMETLRYFEQAYRERDKGRSGSYAAEALRYFLDDEPMPGIEYELKLAGELMPQIGLDEVNGLAREWISERNRVILVSGPEKDDLTYPDESEILGIFAAAVAGEIGPYVDQVREEPLLAELPSPGTITARKTIDEIGVTEWKLSNGVRVVLKPTDFKNDAIMLRGFSPGGTSLVSDEEHTSAIYANSLVGVGGAGAFDAIELDKALAGKIASARVRIGELEETVSAGGSPEDIETIFQLLYLGMTAPRRDPEAIAAWEARLRASLANRDARPETVFQDELTVVASSGHYRRRPATLERLDEIDVDLAFEIFRDRFRDAGDFTFVIVGNFDPAALEPVVRTYLGGLPATGRVETWRDIGVKRPGGVVDFEVRKGLEPKSQVRLSFRTDAEWSREASHELRSLAAALQIRLREVLREEMGATYGVRVGGGISRRPRQHASFGVSFGCAPENVAEMIQAVFDAIEAVKRDGVPKDDIVKVRESQTRGRETAMKENGFWLSSLTSAYRYGTDPTLILEFDDLVERVTSKRLKAAARRYIDTEAYILGVLYPEESGEAPQP